MRPRLGTGQQPSRTHLRALRLEIHDFCREQKWIRKPNVVARNWHKIEPSTFRGFSDATPASVQSA